MSDESESYDGRCSGFRSPISQDMDDAGLLCLDARSQEGTNQIQEYIGRTERARLGLADRVS